tara:strand:+ start:131 stop:667 length:537 start_codon:yes stop_codon:yes gene_type:complete
MIHKYRAWVDYDNTMVDIRRGLSTSPEGILQFPYYDGEGKLCKAPIMQSTGYTDIAGVEIFEGDLVNVCYTSNSGEFIHDCIHTVVLSQFSGLQLKFKELAWESHGHNQYPISSTLSDRRKLNCVWADGERHLCVTDNYKSSVPPERQFPFNQEKELSFSSRYIKVVGHKYEESNNDR